MHRRTFLGTLTAASALGLLRPRVALAALPTAKITRVRIYRPPNLNPLFNQSNMVVTVETDIGITGIGEGGVEGHARAVRRHAHRQEPVPHRAIWQEIYIAWFYPPGREKTHALGALDLALWDIKGKALGLPVHELLGGSDARLLRVLRHRRRAPAGGRDTPLSLKERARATMEAGYRAFRMGAGDVPIGEVYDTRTVVRRIEQDCRDVREAVGPDGNWCIDLHQRFDFNDAVRVLQGDGALRSVLRRGSGPRRARAAGHPEAAADDRRCR